MIGKKVLCIDSANPQQPHRMRPVHRIYEGKIYTVSREERKLDIVCYHLLEKKDCFPPCIYRASRFVLLEDEGVEEEIGSLEEEIVFELTSTCRG